MKRRRKDEGFAMLLVFLMAACVAITLYMEIPRVSFAITFAGTMKFSSRLRKVGRRLQPLLWLH